ncbi:HAD family hydrolase [Aliiroseovarius lamellibrachiae]|uniref:HAD family hydrolase n=1 Tax=Aliiroseovarius lamellibrachiae TaxID=1924933 RepID=UPI001BE09508|nr:HAD family hydrolase [Aliiroseovarius lamellibrachiae]MBT2130947.1 HAD family hydrolase [Aliiroseovarius lamellibrachiae]
MSVKAVLFDKDGTLFHFGATWESWASAVLARLTEGDSARAREIGAAIGFDTDAKVFSQDSIVIAGTPEEVVNVLITFIDMSPDALERILNEEAANAPQAQAVDLKECLGGLKARGIALGVATNDAEMPARAHLSGAGVIDLFDFIAGYDSGFGGKPAPGQCLAFAKQMGVAPEEVVMVGDSLHDLHAGRAAGMRTVGVLTGLATEAELAPHADIVLPDIGYLPNWLDQQAAL